MKKLIILVFLLSALSGGLFLFWIYVRSDALPYQEREYTGIKEKGASFGSPDSIVTQNIITSVLPSPDGKYTLVEMKPPYFIKDTVHPIILRLVENRTKKIIWEISQENLLWGSPQWLPDGQHISFVKENSQKVSSLWISPIKEFNPAQIFHSVNSISLYKWAPDGKKLAAITVEDMSKEDDVSLEMGETQWKSSLFIIPFNKNAQKTKKWTLKGGIPVKEGSYSLGPIAWSPNSLNFTFVFYPQGDQHKAELLTANIQSGKVFVISKGRDLFYPFYSPDSKWLAYVNNSTNASETKVPVGGTQVFLKEVGSKIIQALPKTFAENPVILGWMPDGRALLISEEHKTTRKLYKLPLYGGDPQPFSQKEPPLLSSISLNDSGTYLGFVSESLTVKPEAMITPTDHFDPQPVFNEFRLVLPFKTNMIQWTSFDGKLIEGILIYPLDYEEGRKYPLLVALHDGPYGAWTQNFIGACMKGMPFAPAVFASDGYAVFLPNIRGSSNYGVSFGNLIQNDFGGEDFKDVMTGVDFLIRKGVADSEKLAIWGWGYGSYLALWATIHSDRFKAAVLGGGATDLVSFSGTTEGLNLPVAYLGGHFWDNLKLWLSLSPILHIEKMNTPTLIQYGSKGILFPLSQGKQLYFALKTRQIPVKLMAYIHENHLFETLANSRQISLESTLEWINQYVKNIPKVDPLKKF